MADKYIQIHAGMTVEEVEAILGKPNVSDDPAQKSWEEFRRVPGGGMHGGIITVKFEGGKVIAAEFEPVNLPGRLRFPR
jgi:hypothetical protein